MGLGDAGRILGDATESAELIVGSMPDIALLVDEEARILYTNRELPNAPTIGTTLFDHGLGTEAESRMRGALSRVFGAGEPVSYEVESRDVAGGGTAWYLSRWSPVVRDDRVVAALVVASDITRRVKLERDLERMSHVGSWEWNTATGEVTWSDELYAICGVDRDTFEPSFESFLELIHPEDRDFVAMVAQRSATHGEPFSIDERIIRPDGEERVLLSNARVDWAEDGTARVAGICLDITERKQAERRLEHVSRQQEVILESAAEGILGLDAEGLVTFANPAACELLGRDVGWLQGEPIHDLVHAGCRELASHHPDECPVITSLRGGVVRHMEDDVFCRRDGSSFPVQYTSSPIIERGEPTGVVLTFNDVTERKRFEAQLQYLADHDPMTGLFNRRRFEQELTRYLAYDARYGTGGAVLALDIDNFKHVNDTLGHKAGDEVIGQVARNIRERVRETDTLARLGGDEFILLLPEAGLEQAETVASVVLAAIRARMITVGERQIAITASIGITRFGERSGVRGEELLVEADDAMYDAKASGRNRYSVYSQVS